jgi:hypothetical protein
MNMKKKIIILIIGLFCITGCTNVKDLSYDDIVQTLSTSKGISNIYRTGYSYSLPRGMQIKDFSAYNEVLTNNNNIFYLYVDMVSYYNKITNTYQETKSAYYSRKISYDNKDGYIEINLKENNKYLVEIMYNYAKIEVMVEKDDINSTLLYAISVLKSINYNDSIIANLLQNNVLNYADEDYNIFNTTSKDSNYLNYDDDYDENETQEHNVHDSDLLN